MTRNPDCSLPSLFGACHEEPYKPGAGGFGEWPSTKWPWSFELPERPGVVAPKIHMGKTLYLSEENARLVDPIVAPSSSACGRPTRSGPGCLTTSARRCRHAPTTCSWSSGCRERS